MLSFLHSMPPWAAVALLVLIGVAGTPCYPALMAGLRGTVAEPQREPWGRHVVCSNRWRSVRARRWPERSLSSRGRAAWRWWWRSPCSPSRPSTAIGAVPSVGRPGRVTPVTCGWPWAWSVRSGPRSSVAALLVVNVLGGAAMALLPTIARELRHQHDGLLGWLTAGQGVGPLAVVAGGSAVATAAGCRPRRMGMVVAGGSLLALSAAGRPATRGCRLCPVRRRRGHGRGRRIDGGPAATPGPGRQRRVRAARLAPDRSHGRRRPCRAPAGHLTGPRWSLAALAITATIWTLRSPRGLRTSGPSARRTSPDLRTAVLEGSAR